MKIGSIIAEFNPIHEGHRLLIEEMRKENDCVIIVMSGNFVQRGECAIFEKSERARAAVENGADLVIELPLLYALSSAEGFARGAVSILDGAGCVDELWFGSECGDIEIIKEVSNLLSEESDCFKERMNELLKEGYSFPKARMEALKKESENADILNNPNNILAVEYVRALKRINSSIKPVTIKRVGSGYNEKEIINKIPSATAVRDKIRKGEKTKLLYQYKSKPLFMSDFDLIASARLKTISIEKLLNIADCNEEIAVRLKEASKFNTVEEIIKSALCRRYTESRLRRIICNMIIENNFKEYKDPTYIRPIAFNSRGTEALKKIKSTASLFVSDRGAELKHDEIFNLECRGSDITSLLRGEISGNEFNSVSLLP